MLCPARLLLQALPFNLTTPGRPWDLPQPGLKADCTKLSLLFNEETPPPVGEEKERLSPGEAGVPKGIAPLTQHNGTSPVTLKDCHESSPSHFAFVVQVPHQGPGTM